MALNSGIKALTNQAPHYLVMRRTVLPSMFGLQSMINDHRLVEDRVVNLKVPKDLNLSSLRRIILKLAEDLKA